MTAFGMCTRVRERNSLYRSVPKRSLTGIECYRAAHETFTKSSWLRVLLSSPCYAITIVASLINPSEPSSIVC